MTMTANLAPTGGSFYAAPTPISETDLLALFLRDIARTPLLSAAEEQQLAERVQAGDPVARERFILANVRLVVFVARGYAGRRLSLLDVIQAGTLGLLHAVESYDPHRGVRFASYAHWWIRQAIGCALEEQGRLIHLPRYACSILSQWERTTDALEQQRGRPPTPDEVAQETGNRPSWLTMVQAMGETVLSLEYAEHEGDPAEDFVAAALLDLATPSPEEAYCVRETHSERQGHLKLALTALTTRERAALVLRFGLDHEGEERSAAQVGRLLGISRERVRQLITAALKKLRRSPLYPQLWADLHPEAAA